MLKTSKAIIAMEGKNHCIFEVIIVAMTCRWEGVLLVNMWMLWVRWHSGQGIPNLVELETLVVDGQPQRKR